MDDTGLECPLCAGPLRAERVDEVTCAVGHTFDPDALRLSAGQRAAIAMWSAVSALETEAETLHYLSSIGNDPQLRHAASQAEEDVSLLRRIAGVERNDAGVERAEHDPEAPDR